MESALSESPQGLASPPVVLAGLTGDPFQKDSPEAGQQTDSSPRRLKLIIGQSLLIDSATPIERISVAGPEMVDPMLISPLQVLLIGKSPGVTTFIMWDKANGHTIYDIEVQRNVSLLIKKLHDIHKNIRVEVQAANDSVILWGKVPNGAVITKAVTMAAAFFGGDKLMITAGPGGTILEEGELPLKLFSSTSTEGGGGSGGGSGGSSGSGGGGGEGGGAETGESVSRLWNVSEGAIITTDNGKVISFLEVAEPQQVELQVRIAEINRTAIKELGINLRGKLDSFAFATVPMGSLAASLSQGPTGIISSHDAVILALEERGLATILAEPNLTVMSGQQASFLAGGEFPYVEANETIGGRLLFSVSFREFGVKLDFMPEVKETGIINLKVAPEVSSIDRENAVIIPLGVGGEGFEFPPIEIRKAETTVEIKENNTLVIGGLISKEMTKDLSQVPWIGDVPYIGALFRKTRFVNNETELIIMVTPRLVKPMPKEQQPALSKVLTEIPSDYELFLMGHLESSDEMAGPFGHSF